MLKYKKKYYILLDLIYEYKFHILSNIEQLNLNLNESNKVKKLVDYNLELNFIIIIVFSKLIMIF